MSDYTTEAFDKYEKSDVEGLLKNRLTLAKEKLDETLESVLALSEPVEYPRETQQFIKYFCARNTENNEMIKAGYTPDEARMIKAQVTYYEKIRSEVKLASCDYMKQ